MLETSLKLHVYVHPYEVLKMSAHLYNELLSSIVSIPVAKVMNKPCSNLLYHHNVPSLSLRTRAYPRQVSWE